MIKFIADEFSNNTSLLQNLGTEHKLGGAEQDDLAMLYYLSKEVGYDIHKIRADSISPHDLVSSTTYLIGNFATMSLETKARLTELKNYCIYEHDHKYCDSRNPFLYDPIEFKVPKERLTNVEFYKSARAVFCMTKLHKEIVDKNIDCNTFSLCGSFWTPEELDFIEKLRNESDDRIRKAVIYDNESYHKGRDRSINFCGREGILFDLLPNQLDRMTFLEKLAKYETLVFLPNSPETCSRLVIEAKMLGLEVITTNYVGAVSEGLMEKDGQDLITDFRNNRIPKAISTIGFCLNDYNCHT